MSRLPSFGGLLGGVLSGLSSALQTLASFFRLGPFGAVESPTVPEPARPRLETPEQIVEQLRQRDLLPPPSETRYFSESYICIATDLDTGQTLARIRHEVPYEEGTPRSTRYSQARRYAVAQLPRYLPGEDLEAKSIGWECRLIGGSRFAFD